MNILILGPQARNQEFQKYLVARGHHVRTLITPLSIAECEREKIDFLISSGYAPIIRREVIARFPRKIINLHATFLPWGKGIGGVLFGCLERRPLGVTIHFIDAGVDTGEILCQREVQVPRSATLREIYSLLLADLEKLFFDKWPEIEAGLMRSVAQPVNGLGINNRTRLQCEKFLDLLPDRWDTTANDVEEWGGELELGEEFWEALGALCHADQRN